MKRTMMTFLCLSLAGCFGQLDQDTLELIQTQNAITSKVVEFERNQMVMVQSVVTKYFDLAEKSLIEAESRAFLDSRTGAGTDGVPRLFASDSQGTSVAISRKDVEAYVAKLVEARRTLDTKKREWDLICVQWSAVLDQLDASSGATLTSVEQITEAKKSAQKVLEDIVRVIAMIAKTAASFLLV